MVYHEGVVCLYQAIENRSANTIKAIDAFRAEKLNKHAQVLAALHLG